MFVGITYNKNIAKFNNVVNLRKYGMKFYIITAIFALLFFMIFFTNVNGVAVAEQDDVASVEEELENATEDILNDIDFGELEAMVASFQGDFDLFGGDSLKDFLLKVIRGEETLELSDIFNVLLSGIKESFKSILAPLLIILTIALLCVMFNNVRSGKLSGVSEIIYLICFSVIVIIVSSLAASLISKSKSAISNIQNQMNIVFPILLTLMTTMGGTVSVKAYTPMLSVLSGTITSVFVYVLLPLFSFSLILAIIGNLSNNTKLSKLNGFVSSIFKWVIGCVFAVFMCFLSLKGITAGASDGISIKATKYAIKNYIPLLGGYISDGFELIKAGGMLVKNATGFASLIILLATIIVPIVSIGVLELGLKLLAGVIEPIGDNRVSGLLYDIAKSLKLLIAIIVGVSLMYFLTIFLITCSVSNFV